MLKAQSVRKGSLADAILARPKGTQLTRNTILPVLILSSLIAAAGCSPAETETETVQTETISPASVPSSDTDAQMPTTQTTEIGEERSPNEGGIPGEVDTEAPTPTASPR